MIKDVQEILCHLIFSGKLLGWSTTNWLSFEGNGSALTLRVDRNRAKASRVCKLWHQHFLDWMKTQTDAEARRSWSRGIDLSLNLCDVVDVDFALYDNKEAQDSVWLKCESLVAVQCNNGQEPIPQSDAGPITCSNRGDGLFCCSDSAPCR